MKFSDSVVQAVLFSSDPCGSYLYHAFVAFVTFSKICYFQFVTNDYSVILYMLHVVFFLKEFHV